MTLPISSPAPSRILIVRDEGKLRLHCVNTGKPADQALLWSVPSPAGRDIQLVGDDRLVIGTGDGFEERSTKDGALLKAETRFPGTLAALRLANGGTLLTGLDWQDLKGIVLVEVTPGGDVKRRIHIPGFEYVRLVRPTPQGTWLVSANREFFEADDSGKILWRSRVEGKVTDPHVWKVLRLANGETLVAAGYAATLQWFGPGGVFRRSITGPAEVQPFFYCDFRLLANGNILLANWQGHGENLGAQGVQILEYTPAGQLVWHWRQNPAYISSLQAVVALGEPGMEL